MPLQAQHFIQAAEVLRCEPRAIWAVTRVEARGAGFLDSGEPLILFERHIFYRYTKGKFANHHPDLCNRTMGGYGPVSVQHQRLERACKLDRDAALMSASWGLFQIMGFNFTHAGFSTLQAFVNAMYQSETEHLLAFCRYIIDVGLDDELRTKQWTRFARLYNGPDYQRNNYDTKMAHWYKKSPAFVT